MKERMKRLALVCVIVGMLRLLAFLIYNALMSVYSVTNVGMFKTLANIFDVSIFNFSLSMILFWILVAICYAAVVFVVQLMEFSIDKSY